MATAREIRDLITQTTTGTVRPRAPREARDEVCRYAIRRRKQGAAWAVNAREPPQRRTRWTTRRHRPASRERPEPWPSSM